jgi:group I intron endonuclease
MTQAFVYVITHNPTSRSYVGASRDPSKRFAKHISVASNKPGSRTQLLHTEMRGRLSEFSMQVIETCESMEQAYEREAFFVEYLGTRWPQGFNLESGGRRGSRRHASTTASISAKNSGVFRTPEAIAKRVAAVRGRPLSDEHKAKLSAATKGQPKSEETRARMCVAQKAKWQSDQYRAQMRDAMERASDKKAAAMRALWADPSYRERVMASRKESFLKRKGEGG